MKILQISLWKGRNIKPKLVSIEEVHPQNKSFINLTPELRDVYNIARIIFEIEKYLVLDEDKKRKDILDISRIEIPLLSNLNEQQKIELANILKDLFLFLYNHPIEFTFSKFETTTKTADIENIEDSNADSILLFSGGLDSVIGLKYCEKQNFKKTLLVFINQKSKMKTLINNIKHTIIKDKDLIEVYGPQGRSHYFANTAGILYILSASIFSNLNNAPLVISECGVTSYQPRFSPINDITFTTHPFIIESSKKIYKIFTKKDLDLRLPFNDRTKAEMVAEYGSQEITSSLSCLSVNTMEKDISIPKNCGRCYACLVRRLAIISTMNDPTDYSYEIWEAKKENILPIVEFCYFILKDFNLLDYPQREKIVKYNKQNLFKRFALDTFSALYKLSKNKTLPYNIMNYLNKFDKNIFERRLEELNNKKNFI